jgi:hypothetical protein
VDLPRGYNRRLQRFDPLLRMCWSSERECWLLERKISRGSLLDPAIIRSQDTYRQMREGYCTLGIYPPRGLPAADRLVAYLQRVDTWNMDRSAEQIADVMDEKDASRRAAIVRHQRDEFAAIGSDAYDTYAGMSGARSYPSVGFGAR